MLMGGPSGSPFFMIVSIKHSGTRTLSKFLGSRNLGHFGGSEYRFRGIQETIQFPVRDPLQHFVSWRAHDEGSAERFCELYDYALDYLQGRDVEFYVIEHLPVLDGIGPLRKSRERWWRDEIIPYINGDDSALNVFSDLPVLFDWVRREQEFFSQFYKPFWWLREANENSNFGQWPNGRAIHKGGFDKASVHRGMGT